MGAEMDRLEIAVETQASKANQQLDALLNKLTKVSSALTGVNMGGFASMAAGVRNLSAAMKAMSGVKASDFNRTVKGITNLGAVNTENLYKASSAIQSFSNSMTALSGISVPSMDAKNIKPIINAVKNLMDVDTGKAQQITGSVQQIVSSVGMLGTMSTKDSGVNNTVNGLKRLMEVDLGKFNPIAFGQVAQTISEISTVPDVSNNLNRFISSLAKLAGAGNNAVLVSQSLPQIGDALLSAVNKMVGAQEVSEPVNRFIQSISQLANAGNKTVQTAGGLRTLADETLKFFQTMSQAPIISENTLAMTQALAQLATAGGKVGAAGSAVQGAFNKIQKAGESALISAKKAAIGIPSAFRNIGNSSGYLDKATVSLKGLLKAILPILGIRQLFNWGKQAIEISSDLTEVQNVVDTTFGGFKQKVEDFASTSIEDFGMSELTAKQISSRFQAMGVAMGFSQGKMADMSVELTKLAADMASFYNVEQEDVAESLESIFTGQTRPLRTYGLDLTQATIQEWALKQGLDANIASMSQAEKTLLRYQYVMANTTAAQGDFARTSNTWANQIRILGQSFQVLGSTIGSVLINAFKPLISWLNAVMLKVISVVKTIANALGAIFGWTLEISGGGATSDYDAASDGISGVGDAADGAGGSLGNAADKAEEFKRALMGFDEIDKLPEVTDSTGGSGGSGGGGSGSGGGGSADGATAQLVQTESLFEKYKSDIKSLEELGEYIGKSLTNAMKSIDWDGVYSTARNFGTGLASFLNGLISPELFGETGRLVANSINTALHFLDSFGETFDWKNFGNSLSSGLNSFMKNLDFELSKSAAQKWGNGIANSLNEVITPKTLGNVGRTFASSINTVIAGAYSFVGTIKWGNWGNAIASSINSFFATLNWIQAGFTFSRAAQGILKTARNAVKGVEWKRIGQDIRYALGAIQWIEILSSLGKLIWNAINAGIELWKGLFGIDIIEREVNELDKELDLTGLSKSLKRLGEALSPFVKGFAEGFIEVIDFLVNTITPAVINALATAFDALATALNALPPELLKSIGEALGKIATSLLLMKAGQSAITALQGLLTVLSGTGAAATVAQKGLQGAGKAASEAAGSTGLLKQVLSSTGGKMGGVIGAVVLATKSLAEMQDAAKGGNGQLSEMGGIMDSVASNFAPDIQDEIFKLKEELENAGATTDDVAEAFAQFFSKAEISADDLLDAYTNVAGSINITTEQEKLFMSIINKVARASETSGRKVEASGKKTEEVYDNIRSSLVNLQKKGIIPSQDHMNILSQVLDEQKNSGKTATEAYEKVCQQMEDMGLDASYLRELLEDEMTVSLDAGPATATLEALDNIVKTKSADIPINADTSPATKILQNFGKTLLGTAFPVGVAVSTTKKQFTKNLSKLVKGVALGVATENSTKKTAYQKLLEKLVSGFSLGVDTEVSTSASTFQGFVSKLVSSFTLGVGVDVATGATPFQSAIRRLVSGFTLDVNAKANLTQLADLIKDKTLLGFTANIDKKTTSGLDKLISGFTGNIGKKTTDGLNKTITGMTGNISKKTTDGLNKTITGILGYVSSVKKQSGFSLILYGITAAISSIFGGKAASGGMYRNGTWKPITAYASGGAPAMGQMFVAREAGPELVGRIGSGTAVMNNDQIVASVSAGVYQAVAAAMSQFATQNTSGGTPVINVYVGGKQVTDVVVEQVNQQTRATGVCPILT